MLFCARSLSYCLVHITVLEASPFVYQCRQALQMLFAGKMEKERSSNSLRMLSLLSKKLIWLLFDGTLKQNFKIKRAHVINLNKLKLIYPKRKTDMT
jgi:hypothetical protein